MSCRRCPQVSIPASTQPLRIVLERARKRVEARLDLRGVELEERSGTRTHERVGRVVRAVLDADRVDILVTARAYALLRGPVARPAPCEVPRRVDRLQPVHE